MSKEQKTDIDEYDSEAVNALGVKYVAWNRLRPAIYYNDLDITHLTKSGIKTLCGWWLARAWRPTVTDSVGADVLCARCVKSLNKLHRDARKPNRSTRCKKNAQVERA